MLTTYTLNGIDLDSNSMGTHLLAPSRPRPGISPRVINLVAGNQDGNTAVVMPEDSPIMTLTVRVPDTYNDAFLALIDSTALTLTHDSWSAAVELLGATPTQGMDFCDYDVLLRVPGLFWRDPTVSTSTAAAITSTSQVFSVMSGLSAPVRDAIVRLKGGFTSVTVTDSAGSFFTYAVTLPTTSWLRFEAATGRAYTVTTDTWTGGTEVTGSITNGPGRYPLELTPNFSNPITRAVSITVTTTSLSGSPTLEVRGARAYRI